ncbi:hypothetical protein MSAN_00723400 [Mycena sanguinolenta]|uniref:F-box domain-containing protein n=1 Tax=Mycena sanguinolenta TaxID=230812 RepID=A0A8H6Z804_9AGAR|nr:hypothetical protein MSAN_00723400 [Mycena sanguinolenta]
MSLACSRFINQLNTNYVPSDSEVLEIRSLLMDPTAEIERIDAQIEELESALTQLKEKRALLQQPIAAHKALISPVRLIPRDVLLEIFFHCLPSEHNALIDPTEAPLILGHICRHWRSVAYSAPLLWSSIHIPPLDYLNTPPHILLELEKIVEGWLERSATCPLSVSFYDFLNRVDVNPNIEKHPLILQLLAVSRRLRSLTLAGDAECLRPLLLLSDMPLQKIGIKTLSNQTHPKNVLEIPTFKDVALCISLLDDPRSLPLPWSQLRRLRLECYGCWTEQGQQEGGLDFDGALDVLRMCPNLEECKIRVTKDSEPSGATRNSTSIILPQLHTLIFRGWGFQLPKWISNLVVPNLRYLQIGEVSDVLGTLANASPSNHGGLTVNVDPNRFTSLTGLHELLQAFPAISHLRMSSSPYPFAPVSLDDQLMELFCPPHNLCPMLTDVVILAPSAGFSDDTALAFIKARMSMPVPLQRFSAQFNRPRDLDIMPKLEAFISEGLQVELGYPPLPWVFNAQNGLYGPALFY